MQRRVWLCHKPLRCGCTKFEFPKLITQVVIPVEMEYALRGQLPICGALLSWTHRCRVISQNLHLLFLGVTPGIFRPYCINIIRVIPCDLMLFLSRNWASSHWELSSHGRWASAATWLMKRVRHRRAKFISIPRLYPRRLPEITQGFLNYKVIRYNSTLLAMN